MFFILHQRTQLLGTETEKQGKNITYTKYRHSGIIVKNLCYLKRKECWGQQHLRTNSKYFQRNQKVQFVQLKTHFSVCSV